MQVLLPCVSLYMQSNASIEIKLVEGDYTKNRSKVLEYYLIGAVWYERSAGSTAGILGRVCCGIGETAVKLDQDWTLQPAILPSLG